MSTTARKAWLKILRTTGVKHFRATSALGVPFICYLGDQSGEAPFYEPHCSSAEVALMASWCREIESPIVFDIGANNGFIATQLAQLLVQQKPRIYAFEPVPSTFAQLEFSVDSLGLRQSVFPICQAISDSSGTVTIGYNAQQSLFAQVRNSDLNTRVGAAVVQSKTTTVDEFIELTGMTPVLIKVDVEGFEPRVLKGARRFLDNGPLPAVCLEWNPVTLSELNESPAGIIDLLSNYVLHYVDDFEGQKRPFGERIADPRELKHVCNIFAVPAEMPEERWLAVKQAATQRCARLG